VLGWADSRYATPALGVHAASEAVFFPVPPDPLLMALTLSEPRRWFTFALVCSVASVAGGLAGYAVGAWAWEAIGHRIIYGLGYGGEFESLQGRFREYTFLAILAAGFTPLPYKVFTIAAGTCGVPLAPFVLGAVLSRGGRFFLVAGLVRRFGPAIREKIDRYFDALALAFVILLVAGIVVLKVLRHS
jgi:membrane protein YqaA with SNARE-associated domain